MWYAKRSMRTLVGFAAVLIVAVVAAVRVAGSPPDPEPPPCASCGGGKVVLCPYDGQAGGNKFQSLCLPANAALHHIGEQGTAQAGHEQDYCGVCVAQ